MVSLSCELRLRSREKRTLKAARRKEQRMTASIADGGT